MPKPETTVEDPQDEGLKPWTGKFIDEFSINDDLSNAIAAEQAYQLSRIADALEDLACLQHQLHG